MRWTLENRIPEAFIVALILIISLSVISYRALREMVEAQSQVSHTREVSLGLAEVFSTLKDAETGQRGFLITGEESYLEPYHTARNKLEQQIALLRQLTRDNPAQQQRVDALSQLALMRLNFLGETIELRRRGGLEAAVPIIKSGRGKLVMDRVRAQIAEMEAEEQQVWQKRQQQVAAANRGAMQAGAIFSVLATLLTGLAIMTFSREFRRRQRAEQALRQAFDELEQKVVERTAQLQASREWFHTTLKSIGDGVIATDSGGNVSFLNPVAERLTGWKQTEAVGRPIAEVFEIVNQETRQKVENPVASVLREGLIVGLANHTVLIARDGTERPIDDSGAPVRNEAGELTGAVLVFRDISERYRAEVDQYRLAAIIESSDDAIVSKTLEGIITSWNAGAERIFGYSPGEIVGRSILTLIPPELHDEEQRILEKLRRGERIDHYETVRVAKDGRRLHISLTVSPVRDRTGRIIGASKVARDITARVEAQKERERLLASEQAARTRAEESERWFKSVLDLTPVPILLLEPGTARVTFSNVAADEMAGGEFPKNVPAEEYHNFYFCTDRQGRRIPDDQMPGVRVARGERLENFEMNWQTPRGLRPLLIFGDTLPAMHGRPATGVLVFQDISHLKQIEAKLRQADQLKDEFLATVSHELRTPLNHMLGWIRLLRENRLTREEATGALETIERNARAQNRLIEDLLDVSRIITGKLRLEFRQIELPPIIRSVIEASRPAAEARNVRLEVSLDPQAVGVSGDADRLQQVIWNLVSNAIKFTPSGGRVEVRLERVESHVEVIVSDTGQGIPPEFLPYVFERFSQADSSSTRKQGGLGLGLAIVRHLVELHGGTVRAESAGEGLGATFIVSLPLRAVQRQAERRTETPEWDGQLRNTGLLEGLHVLVVDDEEDSRQLVRTTLEHFGARVTTAASVGETLAVFTSGDRLPDVLVSDIGLPDEDGYSLMTRLRERAPEKGGQIPAIALTAYGRMEDRLRALSAGFQTHIAKPVEPDELVAVVASVAGRFEKGAFIN
ncbi:MAG TPA: PAS domain S-box protein [Blastocatellia bacterium]|nr:PAS domain S-box protein [Blastocatellia bacterium]